jgi:putative peptidoglycan lipid II flippase
MQRVMWLAILIGLGASIYLVTFLLLGVRVKDLKVATE